MKFKRAKSAAGNQAKPVSHGRALWFYFLPSVLVAVVVTMALGLFTLQSLDKAAADSNVAAVKSVSSALANRVAGEVASLHSQLRMLALSPSVAKALLAGGEAAQRAGSGLQALLPGVLQVRLVPKGDVEPDPEGVAPMGYAGVDMLRRTFAGKTPPVEVHQLSSGTPYLAIAVPVRSAGKVVGGLFAAWPFKPIARQLALADAFPGEAQLRQGGAEGALLASTGDTGDLNRVAGSLQVEDSIWQLVYSVDPAESGGDHHLILSLMLGGVLALILAIFLQYRVMARDLRQDMAVMVNLGEAISAGEGASDHSAKVAASHDAVLLLTDLARRTHRGGGAAKTAQEKPAADKASDETPLAAGLPQTPAVASAGMQVEEVSAADIAKAPVSKDVPTHVFRAYDIRGLAGDELDTAFALALGQAFGETARKAGASQVCVAHDARLSSAELFEACVQGLVSQGVQVKDMGLAPAGHLYYAMHAAAGSAGVMVTGSHNPAEYNGFKLFVDGVPFSSDALQALRIRMQQGDFEQAEGWRESQDVSTAYLETVSRELQLLRPLKVVVDAGNGAAGGVACELLTAVGCEVRPLFCEPDGRFPNHHPNPAEPKNLESLAQAVREQSADLGVAFDGDGDRLGMVDEQGRRIWPEHLLMLLAADILQRNPGMDVLYDVKSSRHLAAFVLGHGGRPIMWQSGHTRMREKMRESGALLGGEFSGHLFIQERWLGNDDAIYAAARLLEVLAADPRACSEVVAELPKSPATPELILPLQEGEAESLMQSLSESEAFADARIIDMDGLRVELPEGWGLVRASNTTPSLTFRFEAETEQALHAIQQRFTQVFAQVTPERRLPF